MNAIEALRPVTCVFQIIGLSVGAFCEFKNIPFECVIKCYSILLIVIRFSSFCYFSIKYKFFVDTDINQMNLAMAINVVQICSMHFLEMAILIEAFVKAHQEEKLTRNLLEIDSILINQFNIDLKTSELRRSEIKRLFTWICIFAFISGFYLQILYYTEHFGYSLSYIPSLFTASLTYFQIIIWVDLIRYRLHILNRLIRDQDCQEIMKKSKTDRLKDIPLQIVVNHDDQSRNDKSNYDKNYDEQIFEHFWIFDDLYHRLWIQTDLVNKRYKFSLVLNIGNDFILLVSQLYFVVKGLIKFQSCPFFKMHILESIMHVLHLVILSRAGQHLTDESLQIAYGIHRNKRSRINTKLSSFVRANIYFYYIFLKFWSLRIKSRFGNCIARISI